MTRLSKTIGWKTYAAAVALILAGIVLLPKHFVEGVKWILIGAAFIGLRDALGKVLREIHANRQVNADLRAAIETVLSTRSHQ